MDIKVVLDNGAYMPEKAHNVDAGFDIRTPIDVVVESKWHTFIDTGIHIEIPEGYVGMIKSKSGLNCKNNLVAEGVIDTGYTGTIGVKIYNHGKEDYTFRAGDKITQLVILPIPEVNLIQVDKLEDTERGDNGFGSTGK